LFFDVKPQRSCLLSDHLIFESTNLNDCKVKNLYILLKYIKPVQWHFVKVDEDIKSGLNICVTDKIRKDISFVKFINTKCKLKLPSKELYFFPIAYLYDEMFAMGKLLKDDKKSGSLAQNNVSVDAQLHTKAAGNFQRRFAFPA
jgi:hypothetical protein